MARLVVPGYPHHVTQLRNRRLPVFFSEDDDSATHALLCEWCATAGSEVWACCLMPDHAHLIMVPSHADGLRAALGEAHGRYAHDQFPAGLARASPAEPLRLHSDG